MDDWRLDRVGTALDGRNPTVLMRLRAGFAVIGDVQFLPGYCVLLTDRPDAGTLSDLDRPTRDAFLADLADLAEAVTRVCRRRDGAFRRVNLEILGNQDEFLHGHVWPRYAWEPAELVHRPVWRYADDRWSDPATALSEQHDALRGDLVADLQRVLAEG